MTPTRKPLFAGNKTDRANELNNFYMRFETDTFKECCNILDKINCNVGDDRILIYSGDVIRKFKNVCSSKATGPDGMSCFLLNTFAEELTAAWHCLFQLSTDMNSTRALEKIYYNPNSTKCMPSGQ